MDIIINEPLNNYAMIMYQGTRWRYPSMTDVKFIDDNHIVAAHRYGCKVYIIRIEPDASFKIIDTITLSRNGKPYQTEAFALLNNTIYMLSFTNIMTLIDISSDYRLAQRASIALDRDNIPFHGIAIKMNIIYTTPSKKSMGTEYILAYNTLNGQLSKVATLGDNIRVKGLCFLPNDLVVVIVNYKTTTCMIEKGHTFNGSIRLYTFDFKLLDSIEVPLTHFDCVVAKGYTFYATGADVEKGYIYKGGVEEKKIVSLQTYQTHDFPHGIDIRNDTIAYTSYTTSGIHFINETALTESIRT